MVITDSGLLFLGPPCIILYADDILLLAPSVTQLER